MRQLAAREGDEWPAQTHEILEWFAVVLEVLSGFGGQSNAL